MNKQPVVASRINTFPEYVFSQLAKTVVEVEQKTQRKVLNFGPGSPDVRPSSLYIDKLIEFIQQSNSHMYPGYGAIPELKNALIDWYEKRFGVMLQVDELLPLLGAKDGVSHLPLALADAGDEILVPNPGYPAYIGPTLMVGAKPVFYDLPQENDVAVLLESLKTKFTNKTKYIWVNFPSNPTGQVATLEELKLIVEFALKHHLFVIYDNAYSEITFDGFVAPSI
ncbi:MAG: aminotransferase class I/II-fold pyridoxal phosphate-dependent enzyme, partial [Nanoarchaeota archaeon]